MERTRHEISIHTPLAGSDSFKKDVAQASQKFQSTLPLRGATSILRDEWLPWGISIHTPLAGSDSTRSGCRQSKTSNFNPHSPCGERPNAFRHIRNHRLISIHTPLAGSDSTWTRTASRSSDFNPHSPCGERPVTFSGGLAITEFQSTLPLRGATRFPEPVREQTRISIHTPLAGSDRRNETFLTK